MRAKKLVWGNLSQGPQVFWTDTPLHESLGFFKGSDSWQVTCYIEAGYGRCDERLCMTLDLSYSAEEVKQILQDGYEHCLMTDCFEPS